MYGVVTLPSGFDCSGFVSYVINHCGNGWNYGRLTADGLRGVCTYVSPQEAKPGDLIFFQGTYNTSASHVGIYVGNNMMIHCGGSDPLLKYQHILLAANISCALEDCHKGVNEVQLINVNS